MRLRKNQSDAEPITREAATKRRRRGGRGLGRFSGGQLTTIVCVAIVAAVTVPTAALASAGAFSNSSAAVPAVQATNSNAHGIGIQGTGKKFGVLSNGPLGIAAGKSLSCAACVTRADLSASAKDFQPILASGQSESGVFATSSSNPIDYLSLGITFSRPLAAPVAQDKIIVVMGYPVAHCAEPGAAEPGYLCIYVMGGTNIDSGAFEALPAPEGRFGQVLFFNPTLDSSFTAAEGTYTVTAP